jgi:hypothetical protein
MQKFLSFHDFLYESENTLISADKAPERLKDSRGMYVTKTPKVIYLNKGTMLSEKTKNLLLSETKESNLYLINPSSWLIAFFKQQERDSILSKGTKTDLERISVPLKDYKGSELEKIGDSKDFEYVNVQIVSFKEFNIYRVEVYGLEKYITSPSQYSKYALDTTVFYFINKQNGKFSGNLKGYSDAFGLSKSDNEEKGPKASWAIITAKNAYRTSDAYYTWARNDGHDEPIQDVKDFKKSLNRIAERFGDKKFIHHVSSFKIYYDKDKFIADFKKLSGSNPSI